MKRPVRLLLAALTLAGALVAGALWWQVHRTVVPPAAVEVEIPAGASVRQVAAELERAGVIRSSWLFEWTVRLRGEASRMHRGVYRFARPASLLEVIARIREGDVAHFRVTVPEGLRNDEVLALLARRTGIPLAQWQAALAEVVPGMQEGFLLPETYQYERPLDPVSLLRQMREAQLHLLKQIEPDPTHWRKLRIVASIIEKETAVEDERPLIAAVIENRLRKHMPLQMDPTVIYGIWRTKGTFSGNLRKRDLNEDTPWNTYTRKGLPPTPICNPGAASLRAAAKPAKVDYLYFVADGSGGHAFASTLAAHRRNVARWVRIERERR